MEVTDRTEALRELLLYGSYLQNHGTHLFVFAAPDFLGHKSVFPLAEGNPELFERALGLKALGNELCTLVGGRSIHPITAVVGGFTHEISADEYLRLAEAMISAFINKAAERKYPWQPKPRIVVCIPCGATSVEKRAVFEATIQAGARQAYLIEEPMAAAMGADLPVTEPTGSMVVDIGGGTTEVAVISLGGIVTSSSLRLAGNRLDEAIAMHLRDLLGIKIGERTAEVIKIKIGSILPFEDGRERDMIISGQDVYTEQPKEVTIQSEDVRAALQAPIEEMVLHIKDTFKKTNPDLASDIIQNGILLTGGGGLLSGLDRYLTDKLEIPVWVSETALTNVVSGCLKVLETPTALKQTLMRSK